MSLDLSGYLDVFADEAREHLQNLNQALLAFEKDPADLEQGNVMFRAAHTLKGMSATMGFNEIAELTHKMENLLSPVRDGKLPLDEVLVDLLFRCLDALQEMAEAHIGGEEPTTDIQGLVDDLVAKMEGGQADAPATEAATDSPAAGNEHPAVFPGQITPEIRSAITTAINNGKEVLHLHIALEASCEMRNVRAYMVLSEMQKLGKVLASVPDEKTLTGGELGHRFDMLVASDATSEELIGAASTVLEVELATVQPFVESDTGPAESGMVEIRSVFTFNEYDITVLKQAAGEGFKVVHIHALLDKECSLKSARAFMLHKQLEELGEIMAIVPDVEDIDAEKFDRDLDFLMLTLEEVGKIKERCQQVSEVEQVLVSAECTIPKQPSTPEQYRLESAGAGAAPGKAGAADPAAGKLAKKQAAKVDESKRSEQKVAPKQTQTIRVDTERLDMLLNLVGELVIGKTRLQSLAKEVQKRELSDTVEHFDQIVFDLQNVVMQTRMVPIETVFNRFPRMIRDLAKSCGKQVDLQMEGGETELDRTVIDEIGDPLVHLIRNAIDHGIETPEERIPAGKSSQGVLVLSAFHEGSNVFIQIKDDGNGIDPVVIRNKCIEKGTMTEEQANALSDQEAVEQVFAAGFSTVKEVTDVSGRGVGMDVVRSKIENLSGNVRVSSKVGEGSTFTIKLPLTLAIVQALLIRANTEAFAIPLAYIEETLRIWPKNIKKVNQQDVHVLRGDVLPLVYLRDLLHSPECERESESWFVVVVRSGKERIGLCVDQPIGQMEIVIKSLGRFLQNVKYVAGGTILGDGTVALILDIAHIAE